MTSMSTIEYLRLSWFSKPTCDRAVYRAIRKYRVRSVLEIGMGDGSRAVNMIKLCQKYGAGSSVRYTGVDLFEERQIGQPALQLIRAHKTLSSLGARAQLVPGTLGSAIGRIANSHVRTDLIVISAGYEHEDLVNNWLFFPRMLHAESLVFLQPLDQQAAEFQVLNRLQVERLARENSCEPGRQSVAA